MQKYRIRRCLDVLSPVDDARQERYVVGFTVFADDYELELGEVTAIWRGNLQIADGENWPERISKQTLGDMIYDWIHERGGFEEIFQTIRATDRENGAKL